MHNLIKGSYCYSIDLPKVSKKTVTITLNLPKVRKMTKIACLKLEKWLVISFAFMLLYRLECLNTGVSSSVKCWVIANVDWFWLNTFLILLIKVF